MIDHKLMLSDTLKDIKPSGIRKFFDLLADMGNEVGLTYGKGGNVTHICKQVKKLSDTRGLYILQGIG